MNTTRLSGTAIQSTSNITITDRASSSGQASRVISTGSVFRITLCWATHATSSMYTRRAPIATGITNL